jgi:tetratricopeptide (TPR) repeat protein
MNLFVFRPLSGKQKNKYLSVLCDFAVNIGKRLKQFAIKILITMILIGLTTWLMVHNRLQRVIFHKDYAYNLDEIETFRHFPEALYDIGLKFWFDNDVTDADRFFRQVVDQNMFYMDAWFKLAQAEIAQGNSNTALAILRFSDELPENVFRWKWNQILLADELDAKETFIKGINFLVMHDKKLQDAFQLFDGFTDKNSRLAIQELDTENLRPYLEWLMRWGRAEDAWIAWQKIVERDVQNEHIRLEYINFLVGLKQIERAVQVRQTGHGNPDGMTNAGFENEISNRGFDWRYTPDQKGKWTIRRSMTLAADGVYCLTIRFEGKENISFSHLYQIVPVDPEGQYVLTYKWRGRDLTTDQGPFIDIFGYDCDGLYTKGPMMLGTHGWQQQDIEFEAPDGCHAVVVRLHRQPSKRFDSKIAGRLWLDDFNLEKRKSLQSINNRRTDR